MCLCLGSITSTVLEPLAQHISNINCLLTSLISFLYALISFHHLYVINLPNIYSRYLLLRITTLCFIRCILQEVSVTISLFPSLFLVRVWVEVMFESDNTRKLTTEGGNMAQQCIAVSHPSCVLCFYFLKYPPNSYHTDNTHRNASSSFPDLSQKPGLCTP